LYFVALGTKALFKKQTSDIEKIKNPIIIPMKVNKREMIR